MPSAVYKLHDIEIEQAITKDTNMTTHPLSV